MKALLTVEIYKAEDGWRWKITHRNGNNLANGSESYQRKVDCKRGLIRMISALGADKFDLVEP